jgi:protein gp37
VSDRTHISWADATWNPITGCTRLSAGCDHCYIERTPPFRMAGRRFDKSGVGGSTGVQLHPERLDQPLHWRKPRRIFVCSLADLFHDEVPDEYLCRVVDAMLNAPQHIYQVLTKRPARMRSFMTRYLSGAFATRPLNEAPLCYTVDDPPPMIWAGVSVEDQKWADIRIPILLETPAAIRWISAEPLLGPIDLRRGDGIHNWLPDVEQQGSERVVVCTAHGHPLPCRQPGCRHIDWIVAGGESGRGARPMHPEWARSLRDQCRDAGVPFHFKQAGSVLAREWGGSGKGGDPADWPEPFPREYPQVVAS